MEGVLWSPEAQIVFDAKAMDHKIDPMDSLAFPVYFSIVSALFFVLQVFLIRFLRGDTSGEARYEGTQEAMKVNGAYRVTRLLYSLVLLVLFLSSSPRNQQDWSKIAIVNIPFLYSSILILSSFVVTPRWNRIIIRHFNFVLFATFAVYFYRDIYPLATYVKEPKDAFEGRILWLKITLLGLVAVVIPLFVPREYVPIDAKNPSTPSPEQTASLFSSAIYTFMDPLMFLGYRIPHLAYEKLPPLSDTDFARYLRAVNFKYLDVFSGAANRHIVFGLWRAFRFDFLFMSLAVILRSFLAFLSPLALKQLLVYMETRGSETATIRPWVWVLSLFVGPVLGSVILQRYGFVASRFLVKTQALITQLVLEHSLRIRVKSESSETSSFSQEEEASSRPVDPRTPDEEPSEPAEPPPETPADSKEPASGGPHDPQSNLVGKITNLVTTDLQHIVELRDFMLLLIYVPLQIVLGIVFLYFLLGWSALVGFATMIILGPLPGVLMQKIQTAQAEGMKRTDARVQTVTETVNVIRMVKLFGWEGKMASRVAEKREEELTWIRKRLYLDLLNDIVVSVLPFIFDLTTADRYICQLSLADPSNRRDLCNLRKITITLVMKKALTPSTVFSAMVILEIIRMQLLIGFHLLSLTINGKVSLDRVSDFFKSTELLDVFDEKGSVRATLAPADRVADIGFKDAIFTWTREVLQTNAPSKRRFSLTINGELVFKKGYVNLVLGETGSGKTSLLMALLSEMCYIPIGHDSWYNLPRSGGVAYAAQESWVQNETIKDNILFGSPFDEERYKKVLHQCALERDISLFEAGDATEVGEKGITLSGGQKARITLARAIYSKASVILLDDVLAALDVHTAKWVVDKCLQGDLVKGRTIILVTHNVALVRPIAEFVVSLKNGRVLSQGNLDDALQRNSDLKAEVTKDEERLEKYEELVDEQAPTAVIEAKPASNGKLIVAEEIQIGRVTMASFKSYFLAMGSWAWLSTMIVAYLVAEVIDAGQAWFLGYWASQYEKRDISEVSGPWYLMIYSGFFLGNVLIYTVGISALIIGAIHASKRMHSQLVESVLGTTLRYTYQVSTKGLIFNTDKFVFDIRVVDGPLITTLKFFGEIGAKLAVKFFAVVALTPIFFLPGMAIAAAGMLCGQIYIKSQMSIKREMSNARAPVIGHVGSAIAGLASIRAYGVEERFIQQSMDHIDKYSRTARTFYDANRWIGVRMDFLAGLFASGLSAYLVYVQSYSAANTGFALTMAIGFSQNILYWIRNTNDFEVHGNRQGLLRLERLHAYSTIEQEPKATPKGKPPAYWPASGALKVEKLSARYSLDGPRVLHDVSFEVKPGERVGVVGRTGSGKSSLTLSLLRGIFTEGRVYYDGTPTDSVNLEALRSSITIIPQMPELLSGTIRQNLDPFDQHDDATLHNALRAAGLFSLQGTEDEARLTLDSAISSGGGNLSVGQRQILALARALVRGSKVLILDEATSAIDYKTDSVIQTSLRNELPKDVTVITIAHRLQTIMDADRILVLDEGHLVEFDSPQNLLEKENGLLKTLVDESHDKEVLYSMATRRGTAIA
ncbi:hypothetical protein PQX77_000617 [Marasmius sp. AFHP31]|nr:hypothetical protein PQX77_000617 [Marasmius sp. AFHP31]